MRPTPIADQASGNSGSSIRFEAVIDGIEAFAGSIGASDPR